MPDTAAAKHPYLQIIEVLHRKRQRLGLGRIDLGKRLGAGASTIRSWELFYRSPDAHTLVRWAAALGYELVLQFAAPPIPTPQPALEATRV